MMHVEKAIRKNRTGTATAKKLVAEMLQGTREFKPSSPGDEREIAKVRAEASSEAGPIGSIPPPASVKQAVSTAAKAIKREKPTMFIDKLGARLAFERTGVRLYEALLSKYDIHASFQGGPAREEIEKIRNDELRHFHLVGETIAALGGDPTALTPAADIEAVISSGAPKVLTDPRTTLPECLEAILTAELVDNECWESLIDIAAMAGEDQIATRFRKALSNEQQHLAQVRSWLAAFRAA